MKAVTRYVRPGVVAVIVATVLILVAPGSWVAKLFLAAVFGVVGLFGFAAAWSEGHPFRRKVFFISVLFAPVVVLSGEVALKYLEWQQARLSAPLRRTSEFDAHGMLIRSEACAYQLRPGCQYDLWGGPVRIDSNGFRSPYDVALHKDQLRTRIILTGGSSAFGWGVPDGQDVAAHLRAILNGAGTNQPYEVINAAVPYYTSFHELNSYLHVLHAYSPDIVIVLDGRNDAHFAFMLGPGWRPVSAGMTGDIPFSSLVPTPSRAPSIPVLDGLLLHSALYRCYDALFPRPENREEPAVHVRRSSSPQPTSQPHGEVNCEFIDQFVRHRTMLAREVVRDGGTSILALQPVIHLGKPLTPEESQCSHMLGDCGPRFGKYWPQLQAAVARTAEPGTLQLDLTDAFAGFAGDAYLDECHYTSAGNRIIAERLAEAVRQCSVTTQPGK